MIRVTVGDNQIYRPDTINEWIAYLRVIFAFFYGKDLSKWPAYTGGFIKAFAYALGNFYSDKEEVH